jgi:hypothetical protein
MADKKKGIHYQMERQALSGAIGGIQYLIRDEHLVEYKKRLETMYLILEEIENEIISQWRETVNGR